MNSPGISYKRITSYAVNATSNGDNTVVAASSGEVICVLGYNLAITVAASAADSATFKSNTTALSGPIFSAIGSIVVPNSEIPYMKTAAGEALILTMATGIDAVGHITIGFA